ncbi:hypothetical protein ANS017_21340 [Paraclostridium bifermentans]|uniref:hypothetical protein n=1 Tax=Paraclostridium bifermentans TaxID=1490 RepID=UPI0021C3238F|nr:hypothetical protein [Paraclostridium bifermentans]GKZ04254.1 hypothetical protein ANS014_26880 [Paraclostridium bifermentans]GKZ06099.1 hypothetical protein ANS015_09820 [Paraclostridium bifermentans]GKZ10750.1 hypothetical protein ANS017_21340 [Paraclostridium bifermentans]
MNKEQFKNIDIFEQIEYVNNILKEGKTLTSFSEEIGISRKTISKNFSKAGYKYSQSKKQYILENTDVEAREQKKYYSNITESNTKTTPESSDNIPVINSITTNLEITNNQKDRLTYLMDNADRIKALLDGANEYYKDITESNMETKEDIVKEIYNFKQGKRDYRAKTLKLDVEVQKGFERIAEDLKESGVTQQELLNYILNQYIKFYENIK